MSDKYPGGFVTLTTPTGANAFDPALGAAAPGVWTLDQALHYTQNRLWPIYDPYFNQTTLLLHGNGTNGALRRPDLVLGGVIRLIRLGLAVCNK